MSMVFCRECGKKHSSTAVSCPHCGYNYSAKIKKEERFNNTFLECLSSYWKNYTGWGRATRSEYWYAVLFYNCILSITFIGMHYSLYFLFSTVTLIPNFCLTARRLHDANRSAWNILWLLLPIVGLIVFIVFLLEKGNNNKNKFGSPRIRI